MRLPDPANLSVKEFFLLVMLQFFTASAASAMVFDIGGMSGVMVQPTSNYYHMIYGAYLGTAAESEGVGFQAGYLERPPFKDVGFVDQEWSYYVVLGTKLTNPKTKPAGVWGGIGWSRVGGYIKPYGNGSGDNARLPQRSFIIDGPCADLELYILLHGMRLSLAHQTFVGFASDMQTSAYVAWPYNFLMIKLGISF